MSGDPATAHELDEAARALAEDQPLIAPPFAPRLAAALVAALKELTIVEAVQTASIPIKSGGSYSYKYADIADVVKLTRPVLAEHGLVALTPVHAHEGGLACTVHIVHTSGESMSLGPFPFRPGGDAQATGSAVTYHRRYALVAALGMAAGDDDDGAQATARPRQASDPAPPSNAPAPDEEREAMRARIGALPPPAVKALREAWAERQPDGWPRLFPLKDLPQVQVADAWELIGTYERRAIGGEWGEWVGHQAPATSPDSAQDGPGDPAPPQEAPESSGGAEGATRAEPGPDGEDAVCRQPGCNDLAVIFDEQDRPWCAQHQPL